MLKGFKRFSTVEIEAVYTKPSDLLKMAADWDVLVKKGQTFCPSGACPFIPGEKFDYDLSNFLYYRARAITADIPNQNGDLFPHRELKASYDSFIGKGVYFNHDSDKPEKSFGIILDAVYTPVLFEKESYEDKYIELLCAIDRRAIREKRPGLLEDIETGKVTSTSMGTIAGRAECSICHNSAVSMDELCLHMHPQSPLYCKGRNVFGKPAYETNFILSFIEDSIVYIPADATARMLEIYAAKRGEADLDRMANLFMKYSLASGRKIVESPIELLSTFKSTGGFMATAEEKPQPAAPGEPAQPAVSPYQETIGNTTEQVGDSTEKILDTKVRRIIEEEIRKVFAPLLELIDKEIRPEIKTRVEQEFNKVKQEVGKVVPDAAKAQVGPAAEGKEGKPAPAAKPAPEAAPAPAKPEKKASMAYPINFVEDFSAWSAEERVKLVQAVKDGKTFEFKGELEFPTK